MTKKIITLVVAALVGVVAGALLGYGPLISYKSEGVLNIEMGTSEYKRFTELANDSVSAQQLLKLSPPANLDQAMVNSFVNVITKGGWHKALPKLSKQDAKDLPDAMQRVEQDRGKDRDKDKDRDRDFEQNQFKKLKEETKVYYGLRLHHIAKDPEVAAQTTVWLGNYFKEVATREAVRDQVLRWSAENFQFSDRALEQKLKYEFEIEQAQTRILGFKKIIATYPSTAARETSQVVDIHKDNEKFMSPTAQLVGSESEIIKITEKIQKLNREIEQAVFATALLEDANVALKQVQSGRESVNKLSEIFAINSKKIKSNAEREKLISYAADLSQISARFLSQAQFIAQPSVPSRPERPSPLMYMVLMGFLFTNIAALYVWRNTVLNVIKNNIRAD
jgi:hypothetical protein